MYVKGEGEVVPNIFGPYDVRVKCVPAVCFAMSSWRHADAMRRSYATDAVGVVA